MIHQAAPSVTADSTNRTLIEYMRDQNPGPLWAGWVEALTRGLENFPPNASAIEKLEGGISWYALTIAEIYGLREQDLVPNDDQASEIAQRVSVRFGHDWSGLDLPQVKAFLGDQDYARFLVHSAQVQAAYINFSAANPIISVDTSGLPLAEPAESPSFKLKRISIPASDSEGEFFDFTLTKS